MTVPAILRRRSPCARNGWLPAHFQTSIQVNLLPTLKRCQAVFPRGQALSSIMREKLSFPHCASGKGARTCRDVGGLREGMKPYLPAVLARRRDGLAVAHDRRRQEQNCGRLPADEHRGPVISTDAPKFAGVRTISESGGKSATQPSGLRALFLCRRVEALLAFAGQHYNLLAGMSCRLTSQSCDLYISQKRRLGESGTATQSARMRSTGMSPRGRRRHRRDAPEIGVEPRAKCP